MKQHYSWTNTKDNDLGLGQIQGLLHLLKQSFFTIVYTSSYAPLSQYTTHQSSSTMKDVV